MLSSDKGIYLAVCLNPVIQKTFVVDGLAKGEVNRSSEYRVDVAGKGVCCARVLGQAGYRALHLTQLGGPTRDWFMSMCAADGVELRWVESGSDIRFCTTVIDRRDGTATELVEEARAVDAGTGDRVLAEFARILPEVSTVMLSGTKAAGFPPGIMPKMAAMAATAGKRIFLDIKGRDLLDSLPAKPLVVKPNLEELFQTYPSAKGVPAVCATAVENAGVGGSVGAVESAAESAAREIVTRVGREYFSRWGSFLVVTRGARPTLYWDGMRLRECPVLPVEVRNPIGSGDSFNVGVATALGSGATIAEAVAEGTRLGALNAANLKPGSILPDRPRRADPA
ncbi:MAG: PfkB family carbohydrate kinase [Rectinemataceae bacterium]